MNRCLPISKHEWAIALAVATSKRGTCLRRQVGCVLMDKDYFVLSTGYNGPPSGVPHCNQPAEGVFDISKGKSNQAVFPHACPGAFAASGTNLDGCHAIHAEQNALLRCKDPREVAFCYCTQSPCMTCVKLLMNTNCVAIYFLEPYAHNEPAKELWEKHRGKGTWIHLTPELMRKLETL